MSAPKSVVKIKKGNVEYTSSVDRANYMMFELTRAALRDVGKFIRAQFKTLYYTKNRKVTGAGGKNPKMKVISGKKTQYPRLNVFMRPGRPGNRIDGFYAGFHEMGYRKTPGQTLMKHIAESNVAKIVEIESKYLSALEDEAKALALIESEDDYEDG